MHIKSRRLTLKDEYLNEVLRVTGENVDVENSLIYFYLGAMRELNSFNDVLLAKLGERFCISAYIASRESDLFMGASLKGAVGEQQLDRQFFFNGRGSELSILKCSFIGSEKH